MKKGLAHHRLVVIGTVLMMLAAAIFVVLAVLIISHGLRHTATTSASKATITLNNTVTLNFPCTTQVNDLSAQSKTAMPAYSASCVSTMHKSAGFIYTAFLEQFSTGSSVQKTVDTYCTANASYPGSKAGTTTYVLEPRKQGIRGVTFYSCELAASTAGPAFQATARAALGNEELILEIDAPRPVETSVLQTAMSNFSSTVQPKD